MSRPFSALLLVALLGSLVVGPARSDSCAVVVEWRGDTYESVGADAAYGVSRGRRIGTGVVPPCGEATRGCAAPDPARLTLFQIEGVDPAIAVVADDVRVYAAHGYIAADPRHPLHDVLYGPIQRKRERRGWTCGSPVEYPGTVAYGLGLVLDEDRGPASLESRTRYVDLDRHGVAYLAEGERVAVRTLTCTSKRGRTKVVAERVEALERS